MEKDKDDGKKREPDDFPDDVSPEEYIGQKSVWSEDINEYEEEKENHESTEPGEDD